MKKFFTAILALLFLSTSMGMTVHMHYCMDKFVAANMSHSAEDACSKCGMEKGDKKGCCKDEQVVIKTDVAQKCDISKVPSPESFVLVLPTQPFLVESPLLSSRSMKVYLSNAPPEARSEPAYILNCVFRI